MCSGDNQALSIAASRTYLRRAVRAVLVSEAIQIELRNRVVPLADPHIDRAFLRSSSVQQRLFSLFPLRKSSILAGGAENQRTLGRSPPPLDNLWPPFGHLWALLHLPSALLAQSCVVAADKRVGCGRIPVPWAACGQKPGCLRPVAGPVSPSNSKPAGPRLRWIVYRPIQPVAGHFWSKSARTWAQACSFRAAFFLPAGALRAPCRSGCTLPGNSGGGGWWRCTGPLPQCLPGGSTVLGIAVDN